MLIDCVRRPASGDAGECSGETERDMRTVLAAVMAAAAWAGVAGGQEVKPAEGVKKIEQSKGSEEGKKAMPRVEFQITCKGEDWGKIVIELDEGKAPQTVKNFLRYVDEGFYDGTVFHRVKPDFMIQGGGFDEKMQQKAVHEPIQNEAANGLTNVRGSIAMARTGNPHSATAQFFINVVDNAFLNHKSADPRGFGYCVFGKVVQGMEVVDKIKGVACKAGPNSPPGEVTQPVDPPVIKKAGRVKGE